MNEHYDLVILGGQPAGIIAGIIALKKQLRVAVIDNGEAEGGYLRQGLWYPLESQYLHTLTESSGISTNASILKELDCPAHVANTSSSEPVMQVIAGRKRLNLFTQTLQDEYRRVFKHEGDAISQWQSSLEEKRQALQHSLFDPEDTLFFSTTWQSWKYKRSAKHLANRIQKVTNDDRLSQLPAEWLTFAQQIEGFVHNQAVEASDNSISLGAWFGFAEFFGETLEFPDNVAGLSGALKKKFLDLGGHWNSSPIKHLNTSGNTLSSVLLGNGTQKVSAGFFIFSLYQRYIHQWLDQGRRARLLLEELEGSPPQEIMWVEHVLVSKDVLPEGLGRRIYVEVESDFPGKKYVWISWEYPRKGDLANNANTVLLRDKSKILFTVRGLVEWQAIQRPDQAAQIHNEFYQSLKKIVPFLDDNVLDRCSALETSGWEDQSRAPRLGPRWHFPRYAVDIQDPLQIIGLPIVTPFKNLLRCSAGNLPAFGFVGQYYAAKYTCDLIMNALGR